MTLPRRHFILLAACCATSPAGATPAEVAALIQSLVGDAPLQDGLIHLDLPVMVENGNSVAMTVSVADPPSPVESIHVFAEGNPLPHVAVFRFGPRSGEPRRGWRHGCGWRPRRPLSRSLGCATAGSCWRDSVDLLVTLAACIE